MSKRNLVLLIIFLVAVMAITFGLLYIYQPKDKTEDTKDANFFTNLWPFGKSEIKPPGDTETPADISGYVPPEEGVAPDTRLKKISSFPVAGYGVFMRERYKDITLGTSTSEQSEQGLPLLKKEPAPPPTEFAPFVRYVERATGNIYQTFADKIDERKFSKTVIPKVYEAFFGNKGESVVMRYLKNDPSAPASSRTIETFLGNLPKEYLGADGGVNEITGSFLPEDITDMSVSPDAAKIFYLLKLGDTSVGLTLSLPDNTKSQILESPFTEWLSFWPDSGTVTLTTKPSGNVPGYMYAVDLDKKYMEKILGGITGLTTLASPDGKKVLYSDGGPVSRIFEVDTGNSILAGVRTLPEKCTWNGAGIIYCAVPKFIEPALYPDSWYMGEISFSDAIWRIDAGTGTGAIVADPLTMEGGEDIDAIKLSLDENGKYLFFVNKKDSYLWELELN